jgi:hypothetical protein
MNPEANDALPEVRARPAGTLAVGTARGRDARAPRAGETRPRRLLLCLDGVPYDLINQAKQRGQFDKFFPPARLLSPFPTMTNIALSAMLRASVPLGYETIYFDRQARELRGGIGKYLGRRTPEKAPSSYMDQLDYQEPLPFEFLVYVVPRSAADSRLFWFPQGH